MQAKLSKRAAKFLVAQVPSVKDRIKSAICEIPKGDIKPLQGQFSGLFRLRVGGFRIIFNYMDAETVFIYDIGSRGDIYK
ncbi:MAG TPA: type II toxin-antitoxin system RelE/ParE family toxin [Candidatus Caccocola faecipullorum]|nr:type II toxin-antitoxin system RelE/ParE family toxin [Candidatus Caccocola faecipullorum]